MTDSATWRKSSYSGSSGGNCVEVASWRKSSYSGGSGGDCVEVASWRKSSYSGSSGGDCVEVADAASVVVIRDTKNRGAGTLAFTAASWSAFTASLKG
jgi:hypothetical protein